MINYRLRVLMTVACGMCTTSAWAQRPAVKYRSHAISVDSGLHDGEPGAAHEVAYRDVVRFPGAPWLRLHIQGYDLGTSSFLILRPLADPQSSVKPVYQRLDARSIPQWQYKTALFNGDAVEIELHVGSADRGVFVRFDAVLEGYWEQPVAPRSQCGAADNRVASNDNRVGRMYFGGCTAWRITTGAFLSAGHCVDFDPDQGGPQLPDGVLDLSGVIEFNIPSWPNAANPNDQYPVDTVPAFWRFDGEGQGLGKDWSVWGVFPNSNTGLLPHEAYGFPFRMTRENPSAGNTIRVTGCGSDTGSTNFTLQTATGPYVNEDSHNGGADIEHEYQVDTEGGNSGSPIIWETNGLTVGIHTNAGCGTTSGNHGTSFEVNALENALENWVDGTDTRFVDVNHPLRVSNSGTPFRPYSTVTLGVTNVLNNGTVSIVSGTYTEAAGNTFTAGADGKAFLMVAPVGSAVIGS